MDFVCIHVLQKAKANPALAAAKKEKNDACRERRAASGSQKTFA